MADRWDDHTEGYPTQMIAAVWMSVKNVGREWLAENRPRHFARRLFEPTEAAMKEFDAATAR